MPYIRADGSVVDKRSLFRISIFSDIFWGVVNVIGLFVDTIVNPTKPIPKLNRIESGAKSTDKSGKPFHNKGPNIRTLPKPSCAKGG